MPRSPVRCPQKLTIRLRLQSRVPDRANLFSEVGHKPRATFRFKDKAEVPGHVTQRFVPEQHARAPPSGVDLDTVASGPDRLKFYKRPAVAAVSSLPATLVLDKNPPTATLPSSGAAATGGAGAGGAASSGRLAGSASRRRRRNKALKDTSLGETMSASQPGSVPGTVDVGVQSMYRDGEAQTDAYTPDFVLKAGDDPEVLHLAHLHSEGSVGARLPVGVAEVEYIEEMRERRQLEASLPPLTDEASFIHRKRLMEELELRAWTWHEAEVDAEGERRVAAVLDAVAAREAAREWVSEQRAQSVRERVEADKAAAIAKIQKRRIKTLRKASKARAVHEEYVDAITGTGSAGVGLAGGGARSRGKRSQRDIIGEYADYSSKVYAPVSRVGQGPGAGGMDEGAQFRVEAHVGDTTTFTALATVEATLKPSSLRASTRPPAPKAAKSAAERADEAVGRDLARVHGMLRGAKAGLASGRSAAAATVPTGTTPGGRVNVPLPASSLEREDIPQWRRPKVRVQRPSTPTFDDEDEGEAQDDLSNAVLLLQKLLRGRAVQNMMFEGKERRLELIKEMRQDLLNAAELAEVQAAEDARRAEVAVRIAEAAAVDTATGEVASATLDFLSKELVRRGEMERVNAVVRYAEETRRTREAEEGGRRQAEEALRAKADEVQRQVHAVHSQVARGVVSSAVAAALEAVASAAAQEVVAKESAAATDHAASAPAAAVVGQLVAGVVVPEAARQADAALHGPAAGDEDTAASDAATAAFSAALGKK